MVTIAIAEDEQAAADKLTGYITRYGEENGADFKVSRFSDGVSLLQDYRPEYDVIFLDIDMPHMDGMTLAKEIRERDKVVTLIFVTNMKHPRKITLLRPGYIDAFLMPERFKTIGIKRTKRKFKASKSVFGSFNENRH